MSNLLNPLQQVINQAALTKPRTKTVEQYAQRLNAKNASGTLLLLDISSSMNERVGQTRKIDLLRRVLDRPEIVSVIKWTALNKTLIRDAPQILQLRAVHFITRSCSPLHPGETVIAFHSVPEPLSSLHSIPEPEGGTALHLAIAASLEIKPCHTLVVSDGKPDDEQQALQVAKKLPGTISTLYIGKDDDRQAIAFMKKLALLGCGVADVCDLRRLDQQSRLASAINCLLLSGAER